MLSANARGVITLARVYDDEQDRRGPAFLVERLWPRGVRRADLGSSEWFCRRYFAELDERPVAWAPLLDAVANGDVTLLYSSRDTEHNNALALRDYVVARLEAAASR